jgi:RND family efflux transporter MFP subunit
MNYKFRHPKLIIATAIIALILLVIVFRTRNGSNNMNIQSDQAVSVVAETIGTAILRETIPVTGNFEPLVSVDITPEVSGQLQSLRLEDGTLVDVGVAVKKGQVIAEINRDIYVAQSSAAKAALESCKVALADAEREKDRMKRLFKAGSTTEQSRDKAVTAAELAQAQLKQAQAALELARVNLDKTTIKSPLTGIVSKKYVDEGNMVGPSTPLLKIVRIDTLKVIGGVSERHLPRLSAGQTPVQIRTDAYPDNVFKGTVYKVPVAVDPVTRTGQVEIRVPNEDGRLSPGMFARMTIMLNQKQALVVPDSALIREYDNEYAFVVQEGKAVKRLLKLGLSEGALYEVIDGLSAGDMVITHGQTQLKPGQAVEVVQEVEK